MNHAPIPVVHQDEHLLIIKKPASLLTIPGRSPDKQDCVWSRLRTEHPDREILLVHRLDRDTTGLLIFALSREAQAELTRQFQRRAIHKEYQAIVHGRPAQDTGRIDGPIRKDWTRNDPPVYIIDPERGKNAVTRWEVIERYADQTRMRLYPETGRSHQLRVHMLSIGHPIVADPIYAPPHPDPALTLQLCAVALRLQHPVTGEEVDLRINPPFTEG
jgi:tRNA pseudouridine32 synthase/23S rRNA pseudouridine746 synthase